jgi:outer membrane murein-binding lipoprotein Lpp
MKNLLLFACIATVALFLILPGCSNPHTARIKQIDSLMTELTAVENRLIDVDSAKVNALLKTTVENIRFLQENMDTIDRETAFLIDKYARYKKTFSKWGSKIPAFYTETALRKKQLADLKSDLEKNTLDPVKAQMYYSGEYLHVKILKDIVVEMDSGLASIESEYAKTDG